MNWYELTRFDKPPEQQEALQLCFLAVDPAHVRRSHLESKIPACPKHVKLIKLTPVKSFWHLGTIPEITQCTPWLKVVQICSNLVKGGRLSTFLCWHILCARVFHRLVASCCIRLLQHVEMPTHAIAIQSPWHWTVERCQGIMMDTYGHIETPDIHLWWCSEL